MKFFLLIAGLLAALVIAGLLGMVLLRRTLLPSPLPNLPPSGAGPWRRIRSLASLHGFASWHGSPELDPAQLQAQAASWPDQDATFSQAGVAWSEQNFPFSQSAAVWSQTQAASWPYQNLPDARAQWAEATTAPVNQPQWAPQQQPALSQNGPSTQPIEWNATPFASQHQPPEGWGGRTFASWNQPATPSADEDPAQGNTGKFRRNNLRPYMDVQPPNTNGTGLRRRTEHRCVGKQLIASPFGHNQLRRRNGSVILCAVPR